MYLELQMKYTKESIAELAKKIAANGTQGITADDLNYVLAPLFQQHYKLATLESELRALNLFERYQKN